MAGPKRFWKSAGAEREEGGWTVRLDGRPVRTPSGHLLVAPTRALADATALEWDAQVERVDPRTMPLTRTINTVIERVAPRPDEVADAVAAYAEADLLCYRAPHPQILVERQAREWDPWLSWAEQRYGARLARAEGVMHVAQPPESVEALRVAVRAHDPFQLAALHEFTTLSSSIVLALAVAEGALAAEEGWRLSRIDEDHQAEQWGEDAEATARAEMRRRDFLAARRLLDLVEEE